MAERVGHGDGLQHDDSQDLGVDRDPAAVAQNVAEVDADGHGSVVVEFDHLSPDSPVDITATVATANTDHRLLPIGNGHGKFALIPDARHPRRFLTASTGLAPNADAEALRECAHELATGLLHQFGIEVHR